MHNTVMSEFNAATYLLTGSGSNIPRNNDDISTKINFLRRMGGINDFRTGIGYNFQ